MRVSNPNLLKEFRKGTCEWCLIRPATEAEHCFPRGRGDAFRLDIRENLWATCAACHASKNSGGLSRDTIIRFVIGPREDLTLEEIKDLVYALRSAPKEAKEAEVRAPWQRKVDARRRRTALANHRRRERARKAKGDDVPPVPARRGLAAPEDGWKEL